MSVAIQSQLIDNFLDLKETKLRQDKARFGTSMVTSRPILISTLGTTNKNEICLSWIKCQDVPSYPFVNPMKLTD